MNVETYEIAKKLTEGIEQLKKERVKYVNALEAADYGYCMKINYKRSIFVDMFINDLKDDNDHVLFFKAKTLRPKYRKFLVGVIADIEAEIQDLQKQFLNL